MQTNRWPAIAGAVVVALVVAYLGTQTLDGPAEDDSAQGADAENATVVSTHDGDTLRVRLDGREERVRIVGYDAPEVGEHAECGGDEAAQALADLIGPGDEVVLVPDPTQSLRDDYDRLLRYVETPDGVDVGRTLVEDGWGEVRIYGGVPNDRHRDYQGAERAAQDAERGIWGIC